MRSLETDIPLNPLVVNDGFGMSFTDKRIFMAGGWDQNPDQARKVVRAFASLNIGMVACSAFDLIDPKTDEEVLRNDTSLISALMKQSELLAATPPRMILRATRFLRLLDRLSAIPGVRQNGPPDILVTHCAGANVALIARHIEDVTISDPIWRVIPNRMILLEPMILEGRNVMDVAKANLKHERAAQSDPEMISLQAFRHPDAINLGMEGRLPMSDILGSRGITYLGQAVLGGAEVDVVVGHNDVAAPASELTSDISTLALDIPVTRYPKVEGSAYKGHGYLFAQASVAADVVRGLL